MKRLLIGIVLFFALFSCFTVNASLYDFLNVIEGTTTVGPLKLVSSGCYSLEQDTLSPEIFKLLFFNRFNLLVETSLSCKISFYGVKVFVDEKEALLDDDGTIKLKKGKYKISVIPIEGESEEMLCLVIRLNSSFGF